MEVVSYSETFVHFVTSQQFTFFSLTEKLILNEKRSKGLILDSWRNIIKTSADFLKRVNVFAAIHGQFHNER
jgi:hypothetical protein